MLCCTVFHITVNRLWVPFVTLRVLNNIKCPPPKKKKNMTESSSEALAESESNSQPNNNRIPGGNRTPSVLRLSNNNTHRGAAPGAAPHGRGGGDWPQPIRVAGRFDFSPSRCAIGAPRPQRHPPPRCDWLLFPALRESFEYASLVQIESKSAQRRHNGGGRDADSLLRDVSVRLSQLSGGGGERFSGTAAGFYPADFHSFFFFFPSFSRCYYCAK